jgi:hypothetical protein
MKSLALVLPALLTPPALANVNPVPYITEQTAESVTVDWDATAPTYRLWCMSAGSYAPFWLPCGTPIAATRVEFAALPSCSQMQRRVVGVAEDGSSDYLSAPVLTIAPLCAPYFSIQPRDTSALVGKVKHYILHFWGSPSPMLSILEGPQGMTVSGPYLVWTPQREGTHLVRIRLESSMGSADASFSISVR